MRGIDWFWKRMVPLRGYAMCLWLGACVLGLSLPNANAASPDTQPASDPVVQMLENALTTAIGPSRYAVHVHTEVDHLNDEKPADATKELIDQNLFVDGVRLDIAQTTFKQSGTGPVEPFLIIRSIWDGSRYSFREQDLKSRTKQIMVAASSRREDIDGSLTSYDSGTFLMGQLQYDEKPMIGILKDSGTCKFEGQEDIRGHQCSIVEAKTPEGQYRLSLDPQTGYSICKASVTKSTGDRLKSQPLPITVGKMKIIDVQVNLQILHTERIANYYVPMEGEMEVWIHTDDGKTMHERHTVKRTRFEVDPDFASHKAFIMDNIPEGIPVFLQDRAKDDHLSYIWKNGQVVKDDDGFTSDKIDAIVNQEKNATQK